MYKVGLTGGIASGKSTISQLFSDLGIPVIDTDIISRQLMQVDQAAYLQTVQHFGNEIVNKDGSLNRPLLRKIIFRQPQQKSWLEKMLHPLIRQETEKAICQLTTDKYVLVVVPLMFETEFNKILDHVIAIECPEATQKKRLTQRDSIDGELAQNMISSQMDNQSRLARADSILHNSDDKSRKKDVLKIHHKLLELAEKSNQI